MADVCGWGADRVSREAEAVREIYRIM